MRTPLLIISAISLISLAGCSSLSGNVIPQKGPDMEHIYDAMGKQNTEQSTVYSTGENDLRTIRKEVNKNAVASQETVTARTERQEFHKLPNPELKMYVVPHVAGQDEVPVPGYSTAFDGYEHNYYALPSEIARG
jgi:conjugative transfer region lipoprotein (TIGR03751 family)